MARGRKKHKYTIQPWSCVFRDGQWEIEAYSMAFGQREVVATICATRGFSPDRLASFIVGTINSLEKQECLINEMRLALEMCLECDGKLDWSAEHDAEVALRHAKAKL